MYLFAKSGALIFKLSKQAGKQAGKQASEVRRALRKKQGKGPSFLEFVKLPKFKIFTRRPRGTQKSRKPGARKQRR